MSWVREHSLGKLSSLSLGFLLLCLTAAITCTDSTGTFSGSSLTTRVPAEVPAVANLSDGRDRYSLACASCHGPAGKGTPLGNSLQGCESCRQNFDELRRRIHATMPATDPGACSDVDNCPRDTAAHILCQFNPDLAEGCSDAFSKAEVPPTANLTTGAAEYTANCAFCHGASGEGSAFYPGSLVDCEVCKGTFEGLQNKIHFAMPPTNSASCVDDCAENTAAHILCQFNPDLAEGCSNASTKAEVPPTADLAAGASRFNSQCLGCHRLNLSNCFYCRGTFDFLQKKIRDTMPRGNVGACIDSSPGVSDPGNCAENTAAHIFCAINPSLAEGCPP